MNTVMSAKLVALHKASKKAETEYKGYLAECVEDVIKNNCTYTNNNKIVVDGYKDENCTLYHVITSDACVLDVKELLESGSEREKKQYNELLRKYNKLSKGQDYWRI